MKHLKKKYGITCDTKIETKFQSNKMLLFNEKYTKKEFTFKQIWHFFFYVLVQKKATFMCR